MIVADSNLIAYFHLPSPMQSTADSVWRKDNEWWVPPLWRSEFRSILFAYMRTRGMELEIAQAHWVNALEHLSRHQLDPDPAKVLAKATASMVTAYDAEFIVLAEELGTLLVTSDRQLLQSFPSIAISPEDFTR